MTSEIELLLTFKDALLCFAFVTYLLLCCAFGAGFEIENSDTSQSNFKCLFIALFSLFVDFSCTFSNQETIETVPSIFKVQEIITSNL